MDKKPEIKTEQEASEGQPEGPAREKEHIKNIIELSKEGLLLKNLAPGTIRRTINLMVSAKQGIELKQGDTFNIKIFDISRNKIGPKYIKSITTKSPSFNASDIGRGFFKLRIFVDAQNFEEERKYPQAFYCVQITCEKYSGAISVPIVFKFQYKNN